MFSRVRDGSDFGAGRDSGRRRVLDVHKAADGDAMRQPRRRLRLRSCRGPATSAADKRLRSRPVPPGGEAGPPSTEAKALAALGLRPEAAPNVRTIAR
jgi:hypothetical protein